MCGPASYINTKRPNDKIQVTYTRNNVVPVVLSKMNSQVLNLKESELILMPLTKKKFNINYGVKIKAITNENLIQYTAELKGNIILSIDNVKATDIETVSKPINSKEESQSVRLEMIKKGEVFRVIIQLRPFH
jgi:S1-C subfamily serine protease